MPRATSELGLGLQHRAPAIGHRRVEGKWRSSALPFCTWHITPAATSGGQPSTPNTEKAHGGAGSAAINISCYLPAPPFFAASRASARAAANSTKTAGCRRGTAAALALAPRFILALGAGAGSPDADAPVSAFTSASPGHAGAKQARESKNSLLPSWTLALGRGATARALLPAPGCGGPCPGEPPAVLVPVPLMPLLALQLALLRASSK